MSCVVLHVQDGLPSQKESNMIYNKDSNEQVLNSSKCNKRMINHMKLLILGERLSNALCGSMVTTGQHLR